MQLKGAPEGSTAAAEYLAGVIRQARIPCGSDVSGIWMDCPSDTLLALFHILDTHRRRLLRQLSSPAVRRFLGFDGDLVYQPLSDGGVRLIYDHTYYMSFGGVKINLK